MQLLESLASAFIRTFGITQPTDQTRRAAAWFILGLLLLMVLGLLAGGLLMGHLMHL